MTEDLNTLRGVYFPCLQSILGVILFLRLTHITSQAGCLFTTLLIIISSASTLFTWSSLSAIVTNGQIQGSSGPYYIISRTLGADIGCSLGLLYYIGSTLSCSMFVLGAVEAAQHSIRAYYARWGYGFSGHVFKYDVQVIAIILVLLVTGCAHIGNKYVTLFSNMFICVTVASILCMTIGCILFATGVDNGNLQNYDRSFMENIWPRFEPDPYTGVTPNFFSSLALIYPCVTGMLSGMSKSASLKNPSQSIPRGTFWAIITSTTVYLVVCWLFGMTISNRTLKVDKFVTASVSYPHEIIVRLGVIISCLGLMLGTLSTAPGLISAMATDDVLPFLSFLKRDVEVGGPPLKALWFTALLALLPTLGGNLDHVSPYCTIFYLLMYAGVNMSTCISGFVKPLGFRPTFKYFHWSVSFIGFVWCLGLGFCISMVGCFVSMLACLLLHAYIKKARRLAKTGIKWGTLGSAVRYNIVNSALNSLAKSAATASATTFPTEVMLSQTEEGMNLNRLPSFSSNGSVISPITEAKDEWVNFQPNSSDFHAKNWRPQLLTIMPVDYNGTPTHLHMVSLASQLQQTGKGINVVIAIIDRSQSSKAASVASAIDNICSEAHILPADDNTSIMSEMTGISSPPNDRWRNEEAENQSLTKSGVDHCDTIQLMQRSKALLMMNMKREGMDGFAETSTTDGKFFEAVWSAVIHTGLGPLSPNTILLSLPTFLAFHDEDMPRKEKFAFEQDKSKAEEYLRTINGILNLGKAVILFKGCQTYPNNDSLLPERGTIDIWWMVHDGGLLLLLPFLLSKHQVWTNIDDDSTKKQKKRRRRLGAKLRLFAVTCGKEDPVKLQKAVEKHLDAVRIAAEVHVVKSLSGTNIAKHMRDEQATNLVDDAASLLRRELGRQTSNPVASLRNEGVSTHNMTLGEVFASPSAPVEETVVNCDSNVPVAQVGNTASMLNNAIRTHSSDANLVVVNLPFIHKSQCAQEYFQFVDKAFNGIDNVMLVRGSGSEVVTAYA